MNFLAHLWLAEQARLPLAGAILGDVLRGALPADMPAPLALSVQFHRRIDAATDRHPVVRVARSRFAPGARRFAGIVIDIVFDHVLARDWDRFSPEPLLAFADRSATAIAAEHPWFERGRAPTPQPRPFAALLVSYGRPAGVERALRRTAQRLRRPEGLLQAMANWSGHVPALQQDLPQLLADLRALGRSEPAPTKVY